MASFWTRSTLHILANTKLRIKKETMWYLPNITRVLSHKMSECVRMAEKWLPFSRGARTLEIAIT